MEIGVVIGGIIGGTITVAGYFFVALWHRNKKRLDRDLRTHFEDLQRSIVVPLRVSDDEHWGRGWDVLLRNSSHIGYVTLMGELSMTFPFDENSEDFKAFESHFPEKAKEWKDFKSRANKYIEDNNNFVKDVKEALKEKLSPIPLLDRVPQEPIEYADIRVLISLGESWLASDKSYKPEILETSNKPMTGVPNYANYTLQVGRPCVFMKTYDEAERCKSIFINLQEDPEYKHKAVELSHVNKKLDQSFKEFRDKVKYEFKSISKYGIGKRFKICKENCPICQKIVGESKWIKYPEYLKSWSWVWRKLGRH
jgi:hypothetical protein